MELLIILPDRQQARHVRAFMRVHRDGIPYQPLLDSNNTDRTGLHLPEEGLSTIVDGTTLLSMEASVSEVIDVVDEATLAHALERVYAWVLYIKQTIPAYSSTL